MWNFNLQHVTMATKKIHLVESHEDFFGGSPSDVTSNWIRSKVHDQCPFEHRCVFLSSGWPSAQPSHVHASREAYTPGGVRISGSLPFR